MLHEPFLGLLFAAPVTGECLRELRGVMAVAVVAALLLLPAQMALERAWFEGGGGAGLPCQVPLPLPFPLG